MSALTLQAAYQELANNFAFYSNPTNRAALLNLAAQVDATNSTGTVTLAYSGQMNSGLHSSDVINTLKANKENVRLIDYTDAGKFLDSDDFLDAVAKSFDLTGFAELREAPSSHPANMWLFNPIATEGPWALASEKFISSATGEIWSFSNGADPTRVFGATELPAALKNPDITHINGIAKADLLKWTPEEAFKAVAAQAEIKSSELQYTANADGSKITNADGTLKGLDASKFFEGTGVQLKVVSTDPDLKPVASFYTKQQLEQHAEGQKVLQEIRKPYIDQVNLIGQEHEATRIAALKTLDKMGAAGDILALVFVVTLANDAYAAGDKTKGNQLLADWVTDFAGGLAGGVLAAKLANAALAPLYLTGPAGALIAGGLSLAVGLAGALAGSHYLSEFLGDFSDFFRQEWLGQLDRVDYIFNAPASPLVLDLDGDGVETLNIDSKPIYFDHNNDGFKERTGWADADDGILVRDLNGNGQIDHGGELFGNRTTILDEFANNGFDALRALDSNNDWQFNSADAAWNTVKVWKDSNSNAKLDSGELITLAQAKVASIDLSYINYYSSPDANRDLNQHLQKSVYTDTSGNVRDVHDVWFASNKRDTQYGQNVTVTADIQKLFNIQGSGKLTDLHTAMALDTSGSLKNFVSSLQTKLQGVYSIKELFADTHSLFLKWANVENMSPRMQRHQADGREVLALEKLLNTTLAEILANGLDPYGNMVIGSAPISHAVKMAQGLFTAEILKQTVFQPIFSAIDLVFDSQSQAIKLNTQQATALLKQLVSNKPLIDQITTFSFFKLAASFSGEKTTAEIFSSIGLNLAGDSGLRDAWNQSHAVDFRFLGVEDDYFGPVNASRIANQPALISGGEGHDEIYGFENNDVLDGGAGNDYLSGELGDDLLIGGKGNDNVISTGGSATIFYSKGDGRDAVGVIKHDAADNDKLKFSDIASTEVQLVRVSDDLLVTFKFNANDFISVKQHFMSYDGIDRSLSLIEFADGIIWNAATIKSKVLASSAGNDSLIGFGSADTLRGGNGSDLLNGKDGNDILYGDAGKDILHGEFGSDRLYGGDQDDQLLGGYDNDLLYGQSGNDLLEGDFGNDLLEGGLGDDVLYGGAGSDTYQYRKGEGRDTIRANQHDGNDTETLKLVNALTSEVKFFKENSDLLVVINSNPNDPIRVEQHFNFHGSGQHLLDKIQFSDGVVWSANIFNPKAVDYTTQIRSIYGTSGNETLQSTGGDDLLAGGLGHDTYIYRKGQGKDKIDTNAWDWSYVAQTETLGLADTASTDVVLRRDTYDLLITIKSSPNDEIRVINHFDASNNNFTAIDSIVFSDGISWNLATIANKVLLSSIADDEIWGYLNNETIRGGDGDDYISGNEGNDLLYGDNGVDLLAGDAGTDKLFGGNGNDRLFGGSGNDHIKGELGNDEVHGDDGDDVLEGNLGDDFMSGGAGNNTYIFSVGDGHDTINNNDFYTYDYLSFVNTIKFNNVLPSDILLKRENDDLIIEFKSSSGDQIRVQQHFLPVEFGKDKAVDKIAFSDGSIWSESDIASKVLIGSESADFIYGNSTANTLYGQGSDDSIFGGDGDDKLFGENGDDVLMGESGVDLLYGGNGNDRLFGGLHNDQIFGDSESDEIHGEQGNDTLDGGAGNDLVYGGSGNDTFHYQANHGKDTLYVSDSSGSDFLETLHLLNMSSNAIKLGRYNDDLYVQQIGSTLDHVKIVNHFASTCDALDKIIFSDNSQWDAAIINSKALILVESPE